MAERTERLLHSGVTAVLLIAGAIGMVFWYLNANDYRADVEAAVERSTGFVVSIGGRLKITLAPLPALIARDVRVANPPWAERAEMAWAEEVTVGLDPVSLLFGPLRIDRLKIRNAIIALETNADGRANWLTGADPWQETGVETDATVVPDIRHLIIEESRVSYRRGGTGHDYGVTLTALDGALPIDGDIELDLSGRTSGMDFTARIDAGPLRHLMADPPNYPLAVRFETGGTRIDAAGTVAGPLSSQTLDMAVTQRGARLDTLAPLAGFWIPPVGPYDASFNLSGAYPAYQVARLASNFRNSDLAGDVTIVLDTPRPSINGTLAAQTLYIHDLLGWPDPALLPPRLPRERLFDQTRLPLHGLRAADLSLQVTVARLFAWPDKMTDMHGRLRLTAGRLRFKPMRAELSGGRVNLAVSIDAAKPTPEVRLSGSTDALRLEHLLPVLGVREPPEGPFDLRLDLIGRGWSLAEFFATADGYADFIVGEGALPIWGFDLIAADLVQAMIPWANRHDRTPLNCMVARFSVDGGRARTTGLLIDTSRITAAGVGAVDLRTERLDVFFRPRPKDPSLISLAAPVRISGHFLDYRVLPDAMDLAAKGAATVLLGSINPMAVIVPFLNAGTGVENPCLEALTSDAALAEEPAEGLAGTMIDFLRSVERALGWSRYLF